MVKKRRGTERMSFGCSRTSEFSSGDRMIRSRSTRMCSFFSALPLRMSAEPEAARGVSPPAWAMAFDTVKSPVYFTAPGFLTSPLTYTTSARGTTTESPGCSFGFWLRSPRWTRRVKSMGILLVPLKRKPFSPSALGTTPPTTEMACNSVRSRVSCIAPGLPNPPMK